VSGDGLDPEAVITALHSIDPAAALPVVFGGVVDCQRDLLTRIQRTHRLLGAPLSTLANLQDPQWRANWLSRIGVAHPETRLIAPQAQSGWLQKQAGASGGEHICRYESDSASRSAGDKSVYYQQYLRGRSLSVTAIVSADSVRIVGYADQTPAGDGESFRFEGARAITATSLESDLSRSLNRAVLAAVDSLPLAGLVSFDFIVCQSADSDGEFCYLLEINARPSANFELFDANGALFRAHLEACDSVRRMGSRQRGPHRLVDCSPTKLRRGFSVVYAARPVSMPANFSWPHWARDRSPAGRFSDINEPLCTVHADTAHGGGLAELLAKRSKQIHNRFQRSSIVEGGTDQGNVV